MGTYRPFAALLPVGFKSNLILSAPYTTHHDISRSLTGVTFLELVVIIPVRNVSIGCMNGGLGEATYQTRMLSDSATIAFCL
jgi:hypothetical protein